MIVRCCENVLPHVLTTVRVSSIAHEPNPLYFFWIVTHTDEKIKFFQNMIGLAVIGANQICVSNVFLSSHS